MTKQTPNGNSPSDRKQRLAEALRANLQRRKSQSRERRAQEPPAPADESELPEDDD